MEIKNLKQWAIIILILCWLGWRLAVPVDLVKSDLGRHIKNGELILQGNWDILYKNFYTYTNPGYPFINEHWLFGVFCFVCWHFFGFAGLGFIYLLIELFTFYVFFRCWQRFSSFAMCCAFGLLSFPFLCFRSEIRPEGISYLFCGLFWWLIDSFQQKRLNSSYLFIILCFLQIIWVNTHLFFVMGPFLTLLFCCQARAEKREEQAAILLKLFFLLLGMCLINPSGIAGALAPFTIDRSYFEYPIVEQLSVFSLLKAGIFKTLLLYFLFTVAMLGAALFFLIRKEGLRKYFFIASLTLVLSLAAMKINRIIGLFGYFWMPLSACLYSGWLKGETDNVRKNVEIVLVVLGIIVSVSLNFEWKQLPRLGLVPGTNDAGEFFKREKISGPIFNNADIGGYLIYHLSPQYKLFIDNRIEPFPEDFLKKTYVQMMWYDDRWHELEGKYHFNVIVFAPEQSVWGFKFFVNRIRDRSWALVYLSDEVLIFLKRNALNADLIRRDEIRVDMQENLSLPKDIPYK